jgi:hypothetical protein
VNSRDTNTAAEKYSRLYWHGYLYLFKIYNMGYGKQALSSILERHFFLYFTTAVFKPARGPTSFLPSGHWAHYHFTESPAVKVTTRVHLVPMLRMHGATPPVAIMSTWRRVNNSITAVCPLYFSASSGCTRYRTSSRFSWTSRPLCRTTQTGVEMGRYMPVCHTGPSFVPTFHTGTVCFSAPLQQNEV